MFLALFLCIYPYVVGFSFISTWLLYYSIRLKHRYWFDDSNKRIYKHFIILLILPFHEIFGKIFKTLDSPVISPDHIREEQVLSSSYRKGDKGKGFKVVVVTGYDVHTLLLVAVRPI